MTKCGGAPKTSVNERQNSEWMLKRGIYANKAQRVVFDGWDDDLCIYFWDFGSFQRCGTSDRPNNYTVDVKKHAQIWNKKEEGGVAQNLQQSVNLM